MKITLAVRLHAMRITKTINFNKLQQYVVCKYHKQLNLSRGNQ